MSHTTATDDREETSEEADAELLSGLEDVRGAFAAIALLRFRRDRYLATEAVTWLRAVSVKMQQLSRIQGKAASLLSVEGADCKSAAAGLREAARTLADLTFSGSGQISAEPHPLEQSKHLCETLVAASHGLTSIAQGAPALAEPFVSAGMFRISAQLLQIASEIRARTPAVEPIAPRISKRKSQRRR